MMEQLGRQLDDAEKAYRLAKAYAERAYPEGEFPIKAVIRGSNFTDGSAHLQEALNRALETHHAALVASALELLDENVKKATEALAAALAAKGQEKGDSTPQGANPATRRPPAANKRQDQGASGAA